MAVSVLCGSPFDHSVAGFVNQIANWSLTFALWMILYFILVGARKRRCDWAGTAEDGVTVYRSPGGTEALTVATYRLRKRFADEEGLAMVLRKSAEVLRQAERSMSEGHVVLSAVKHERRGPRSQLRYSGHDHRTDRRFVRLTVASRRCMQSFYFEAIGLSGREFGERAAKFLGTLGVGATLRGHRPPGIRLDVVPSSAATLPIRLPYVLNPGGVVILL